MGKKEVKKFTGTHDDWERMADRIARSIAPDICHCKTCDYPVVKGYCCTYCGDTNPSSKE